MIKRKIDLPRNHSFFLFGPRQTGKSLLLRTIFSKEKTLYYDLLQHSEFLRLENDPNIFREEVLKAAAPVTHIIVDEIQKLPWLLDEIHSLMETRKDLYFCMTGSSARKLKRGQANLLGGRAWAYYLFPLTHQELGDKFSLTKALELGTLPPVYLAQNREDSLETLRTYVGVYLKEEIQAEALTRDLGGFIRFLNLAADENGNLLNFANISRETGTPYQKVKEYFQILEDTLIGFFLMPYDQSERKRLVKQPKFYFFDTGVQRAVAKKADVKLQPRTSEFGNTFEHFLIAEIKRLASYKKKDYDFFFYQSTHHAEVDLVIQTPAKKTFAIEIKATEVPDSSQLKGLRSFKQLCPEAECYCVCLAPRKRMLGDTTVLPWQEIFEILGL